MSFSLPWYYYWIIPVAIIVPLLRRLIEALLDNRRYARAGLQEVKRMHWRDFEKYLAHLFQSMGYEVELTPPAGDNGVDVILTDSQGCCAHRRAHACHSNRRITNRTACTPNPAGASPPLSRRTSHRTCPPATGQGQRPVLPQLPHLRIANEPARHTGPPGVAVLAQSRLQGLQIQQLAPSPKKRSTRSPST